VTRVQFAAHAMTIAAEATRQARKELLTRFPGQAANGRDVAMFCQTIREFVDDLEKDNA